MRTANQRVKQLQTRQTRTSRKAGGQNGAQPAIEEYFTKTNNQEPESSTDAQVELLREESVAGESPELTCSGRSECADAAENSADQPLEQSGSV